MLPPTPNPHPKAELYAQHILDHHRHPRFKKPIKAPSVTHAESNPACGDILEIFLKIERGILKEVGWNGSGCALSQAGISILLEKIAGAKIADVAKLSPADMRALLGVPLTTRRLQCAFLSLLAVRNALRKKDGAELLTWAELLEDKTQ